MKNDKQMNSTDPRRLILFKGSQPPREFSQFPIISDLSDERIRKGWDGTVCVGVRNSAQHKPYADLTLEDVDIDFKLVQTAAIVQSADGRILKNRRDYYSAFYVQDARSYVGNCILWWCQNGAGYTTQLDEAGLYTEEECQRMRSTDIPWPKEIVDAAICKHVRIEHLNREADKIGFKAKGHK